MIYIDPCDWDEPHETHVKPGALRNTCLGFASALLGGHVHSGECANRRLTDQVMRQPFRCICWTDQEVTHP